MLGAREKGPTVNPGPMLARDYQGQPRKIAEQVATSNNPQMKGKGDALSVTGKNKDNLQQAHGPQLPAFVHGERTASAASQS